MDEKDVSASSERIEEITKLTQDILSRSFENLRASATVKGEGETRFFFPNGVESIDVTVKASLRGSVEVHVKVAGEKGLKGTLAPGTSLNWITEEAPLIQPSLLLPRSPSDRVQKAKDLLAEAKVYSQGCSGFVCDVLGIPWESANDLMGTNPKAVGDNNSYQGLQPGDIAGWTSSSGSGHVTVYVGEPGMKFIDVRSENERPRKVGNGYGNGRPLYKSGRF
jgi:hypothetical protein